MTPLTTLRLHNQQIGQSNLHDPVDILSWMGAIQGQDYEGAKWSLGLRAAGTAIADIERTIADKHIVRTWLFRGTLFLVTGADARWMTELVAPRVIASHARRYKELELDEATLTHTNDIFVKALQGGKSLTRRELLAIVEAQGISTKGQRSAYMLHHASLEGLIVQVGMAQNNNPYYMRFDEALPAAQSLARDDALAELARRYFTSHGPATVQDFAWWTGLLMADVRAGFEAVQPELVEDVVDGESYWLCPSSTVQSTPSPTAYTPPGFDEYFLGYKDRDVIVSPEYAEKVCPGKNGVFYPTIVIDGRVVGTWKRTIKKKHIIVTPAPFEGLSADEYAAFTQAIGHYGDFMQMPIEIVES